MGKGGRILKMIPSNDLKTRKSIWLALSHFYLDTELQEVDFKRIAQIIQKSPYSMEEVKQINKYEIFPVLQANLRSTAGEWMGFEAAWLIKEITQSLEKRNWWNKLKLETSYLAFKWMQVEYWEKLERAYYTIKGV